MPREDKPLEGALFERRGPGVDIVEIPFLGLPAGLPQDIGEGFLPLPLRPGGNQDDVISPDRLDQIGAVLLLGQAPGERPEGLGGCLVADKGIVQVSRQILPM